MIKFSSFRIAAILITDANSSGNLTFIGRDGSQSLAGMDSAITIDREANTATVRLTPWSSGIIIGKNIESISYA